MPHQKIAMAWSLAKRSTFKSGCKVGNIVGSLDTPTVVVSQQSNRAVLGSIEIYQGSLH